MSRIVADFPLESQALAYLQQERPGGHQWPDLYYVPSPFRFTVRSGTDREATYPVILYVRPEVYIPEKYGCKVSCGDMLSGTMIGATASHWLVWAEDVGLGMRPGMEVAVEKSDVLEARALFGGPMENWEVIASTRTPRYGVMKGGSVAGYLYAVTLPEAQRKARARYGDDARAFAAAEGVNV